jgi:hypothetical protein
MHTSEVIRRRRLPHWDVPTAAYFVTTCLEGSIPPKGCSIYKIFEPTWSVARNRLAWKKKNGS